MFYRERICDLVEPRKGKFFSRVYDFIMLMAIIIGTAPLLFRVQYPIFWYFDVFSGACYIIDYLLRWMTCDFRSKKNKWIAFLTYPITPLAIIDLLSILPTINLLQPVFKLTRISRLFKILRFIKIVHYFEPLEIFVTVVKKQRKLLLAVLTLAFFDIFITAIIMFQTEREIDPVTGKYIFESFFDAFYWAACTLTTVGYGDLYPVSDIGRAISIFSSLLGIAVIALPSSIITAGYIEELRKHVDKSEINSGFHGNYRMCEKS
ncbi:MAG: ion transporter [Bacteroidaceae bacterium]|nr:ion transporter [Bacteroidaceae bacterium]